MIYYNPIDKFYKSITGAISADKKVTFRVKGDFDSVLFVLKKDEDNFYKSFSMVKKQGFFELELQQLEVGLYWYYFDLCNGKYISLSNDFLGSVSDCINNFQLTVYDSAYSVPQWFKGGLIYQIFPDRFYSSIENKTEPKGKILHKSWDETPVFMPNDKGKIINNDFFGGDFKGIIEKLPYLKSLGVSVIYLNPIFKSFSNHRYDTGDYLEIDPLLGDEKDFNLLVNKALELDIKIVLDGVFNHTGDDSVYFNKYGNYSSIGAYQAKSSKYYDWFKFKDYPEDYESWWGITTLPATNKNNKDFLKFITGKDGVLQKYTKMGIGGWRLDVVDELPDFFVENIRKAIKEIDPDAIIIGEVWEDASNKIAYGVRRKYFQGKELDSVMNYPLKNAILDFVLSGNVDLLSSTVKEQIDHYPNFVLDSLMNLLSTHDTFRLLSALSGIDVSSMTKEQMSKTSIAKEDFDKIFFKLQVASILQYTLRGVPSLYYGDEVGMQGFKDPLNRYPFPWGKENTVILDWFKFLGELRKEYPVFIDGEYFEIYAKNGVYAYKRCTDDCEIAVLINLSDNDVFVRFEGALKNLIDERTYYDGANLEPQSFLVFANE